MVFLIAFLSITLTLGKILNPLDPRMFNFHDDTQASRIQQMALNIKTGHIPPRLAPTLSYGLGFPVFNFYAPFSYQITTGFHLLGMSVPMALKFSFFLSVILSFVTMFLLLQTFLVFFQVFWEGLPTLHHYGWRLRYLCGETLRSVGFSSSSPFRFIY